MEAGPISPEDSHGFRKLSFAGEAGRLHHFDIGNGVHEIDPVV
jgi:hypothetical protein